MFTVFTAYPVVTLAVSAVFILSLSVGLAFMEITTDPVELWAAPQSRSRQEKCNYLRICFEGNKKMSPTLIVIIREI